MINRNKLQVFILLILFPAYLCQDIDNIFKDINNKVLRFNARAAEIAWESSINPGNPDLPQQAGEYQEERMKWERGICRSLGKNQLLNSIQARQMHLLCRGPKYNFKQARELGILYENLQTIYTEAEICIPSTKNITILNKEDVVSAILKHLDANKQAEAVKKTANKKENNELCLKGEDDFEKVMEFSRNEAVLKWTWVVWREKMIPMKETYRRLVDVENAGSRWNGYHDLGVFWLEELEIPHLRRFCRKLLEEVKPLYSLLHGVVRFYLRRHYGDIVPEKGPIPAHLLGNLWSQNWEPLVDLIAPKTIDLNESIKKLNWTVLHMVKQADDFYQSFGLPPMTDKFWRESVFARGKNTRCHGAAADMFNDGDFRLLYCSGTTIDDFYVIHHEMGHIQYYMAYENQSALFRQANTAFHESIGDAIMYGVLTPQHLHRLGLINDTLLYKIDTNLPSDSNEKLTKEDGFDEGNFQILKDIEVTVEHNKLHTVTVENDQEDDVFKNSDDILMLKQALNKLPQIPFALVIDTFRWNYFEGDIADDDVNKIFWRMSLELQGIAPPTPREEEYFDIGAKFHVPDNTPYIRYFLSSFLQHQLFENLCKAAVFGRRDARDTLPDSITLNRCDIYGSKAAGKLLKDIMSRGHSQHWLDILYQTTGERDITASSLLRYYRPLEGLLKKLVRKYDIPIGWSKRISDNQWADE